MEDTKQRYQLIAFTPKNFHLWMKELKGIAVLANVWQYIDPAGTVPEPVEAPMPSYFNYPVTVDEIVPSQAAGAAPSTRRVMRGAVAYSELSDTQKDDFKAEMNMYHMVERHVNKVNEGLAIVANAIKQSARTYIPSTEMASPSRKIVKLLNSRYGRTDAQIVEQLHDQFARLKEPPVKAKIDSWVAEWEDIHGLIVDKNVTGIFGGETVFINEFLRAGKRWAPNFCENWVMSHLAAGTAPEFFNTTRHYRTAAEAYVEDTKGSHRSQANAATLQNQAQPQGTPASNKSQRELAKERYLKGRKCVCGQVHLFKMCPYILKANRPAGWKEEKSTRDAARSRIETNIGYYHTIRKLTDTNIVDGMTEDAVEKSSAAARAKVGPSELPEASSSSYHFGNAATRFNPLHTSVLYDSANDVPLTWDRSRFVEDELRPAGKDEWYGTPTEDMQVMGYGTMKVVGSLNGKPVDLFFRNAAYVPKSNNTLVSTNLLFKQGFYWNMKTEKLVESKTDKEVCDIQVKFGLAVLEYNNLPYNPQANSVHRKTVPVATPWTWHLRLGHCRPEVIEKVRKIGLISDSGAASNAPKTVECETCSLSKMHRLIQREPVSRAVRPNQVLHFDLTISNRGFDGTSCIAHFTDEVTKFNWVYPLPDHKEKTLLPVFKSLINECDRAGMATNSVVSAIRTGQETSIGSQLERWVRGQGISWQWSSKNTPEQNGTSERHGALLTEKARCIRTHAKLPEEMYPECYLAACYLMNRTPTEVLNWDSPLISRQKLVEVLPEEKLRWEISHLKVFGCKAFPLLKGADAPPRSEKMKPRAFIGYLIGYDSTNIFRVWDPNKGTVSGYRDVIFNEDEFHDRYRKADLISEEERQGLVEFEAYRPRPSVPFLTDAEIDWLDLPVRARLNIGGGNAPGSPPNDSGVGAADGTLIQTPIQSPSQTPFQTPENGSVGGDKIEIDERQMVTPEPEASISENITITRRKRGGKRITELPANTPASIELPLTGQTPLDVTENAATSRQISADIADSNIIEGKRARRPNTKYAFAATTGEESEISLKFPRFHAAFHASFLAGTARPQPPPLHSNDLPEPPSNWGAMLRHPHAEGFKKAASIEWEAIWKRGTWEVVDKAENMAILPLKWVFTYKQNEDGYLIRHKARLVVRGDLQEMDHQDVYAATLAFKVFRALMALVAAFGLKTTQLDAVNAFLNAHNDEAIFCHLPEGYKSPKKCLKVIKALYGQRKSPLLWLRLLTQTCINMGLLRVPGEPCLFTNGNGIFLFFYVDDIIVAYRDDREDEMKSYKKRLCETYEMKELETKFFLGVRVLRNFDHGTLCLVQDAYMDKLAKEYDIDPSTRAPKTPLPYTEGLVPFLGKADEAIIHDYRKKVGSICYPAIMTRPDVARSASKLAEFLVNPGPDHLAAANHCLHYLYTTKYLGIKFSASGGGELSVLTDKEHPAHPKHIFEGTADASFATNADRKSNEGFTFKLFGGLIDWASRKQATVSTSTTEAELLALLHAGKEILWWTHLFQKLAFDPGHDVVIYNDNLQTIRLMNSEIDRTDTKLKHIDIAQCWLRESVQMGNLVVKYLPTADMVADGLTKLLPPQRHSIFVKQLGLVDTRIEELQ